MILKKPYAFFIKNFKLFYLIIFSLAAVLLYRTSIIYSFIKEYVKESPNVIGKELTDSLFVNWSYILIILLIAVNILIIIIMIRKSKPYMFYIVNIILYISVLVVYGISNIVISNLEVMLVEAKITMAIRNILNIIRMLQTISIIFYFVRVFDATNYRCINKFRVFVPFHRSNSLIFSGMVFTIYIVTVCLGNGSPF